VRRAIGGIVVIALWLVAAAGADVFAGLAIEGHAAAYRPISGMVAACPAAVRR
jgi:hypothetical protein